MQCNASPSLSNALLHVQGYNPREVQEMLDFRPDRIAHCCCLTPALRQQLLQ